MHSSRGYNRTYKFSLLSITLKMHSCCYSVNVPQSTSDSIYYPFRAGQMRFKPSPNADLSSLSNRIPIMNINGFINDINNILATERRRTKFNHIGLALYLGVLVLSLILTVVNKSLFYLIISALNFILIVYTLIVLRSVLTRLTPRLQTLITYRGQSFRNIGLNWELGTISGKPSWILLQILPYNGPTVTNPDTFGYIRNPIINANRNIVNKPPIMTAELNQDIAIDCQPQNQPYHQNQGLYLGEGQPMVMHMQPSYMSRPQQVANYNGYH